MLYFAFNLRILYTLLTLWVPLFKISRQKEEREKVLLCYALSSLAKATKFSIIGNTFRLSSSLFEVGFSSFFSRSLLSFVHFCRDASSMDARKLSMLCDSFFFGISNLEKRSLMCCS